MDGMFGGGNKFNPTMSNATRASALGASNPLIRPN
jgi:hypothetical protein